MITEAAAVTLGEIALEATKAVLLRNPDSMTPEQLAERLVGDLNLAPLLRQALNAADAKAVDEAVDVAEEAKLAALAMGVKVP